MQTDYSVMPRVRYDLMGTSDLALGPPRELAPMIEIFMAGSRLAGTGEMIRPGSEGRRDVALLCACGPHLLTRGLPGDSTKTIGSHKQQYYGAGLKSRLAPLVALAFVTLNTVASMGAETVHLLSLEEVKAASNSPGIINISNTEIVDDTENPGRKMLKMGGV